MADLADIQLLLSGTDGTTGGAIGSNEVLSQTATYKTTAITGVTLADAAGNGIGDGTLTYTHSSTSLTWVPNNGGAGTAVDVVTDGDGTYVIQGSSDGGFIDCTIVGASLPTSNTTVTVTIAEDMNEIYDDVTKDESDSGVTRYRCIYYKNNSSDAKKAAKLWISSNTDGADTISIALDAAGLNATAATIADENTAPAGATFTAPSTEATALSIGDIPANQYYAFWVKQEVPAGTDTETLKNHFRLGHSVKV